MVNLLRVKIQTRMQKKRFIKSTKKGVKSSISPKKNICNKCKSRPSNVLVIAHSLYGKYSLVQNHYYLVQFNSFEDKLSQSNSTVDTQEEEFLSRYHKKTSRKQTLQRLKDAYATHQQIPRIFHQDIKEILVKCHHRKRLILYFKVAKSLGIKVQSVNFSSFLLSFSLPGQQPKQGYKKVLVDLSKSEGTEGETSN